MGLASDLYRGRNDFGFPACGCGSGSSRPCSSSSGVDGHPGLNLSIDFEGGSVWEVRRRPSPRPRPHGSGRLRRQRSSGSGGHHHRGRRVIRVSGRVDNVAEGPKHGRPGGLRTRGARSGSTPSGRRGAGDYLAGPPVAWSKFMHPGRRLHRLAVENWMAIAAMAAVIRHHHPVGVYRCFESGHPGDGHLVPDDPAGSRCTTRSSCTTVQENATRTADPASTLHSLDHATVAEPGVHAVAQHHVMVTIIPVIVLVVRPDRARPETPGDFSLALLIGLVGDLLVAVQAPAGHRGAQGARAPLASESATPGRQGSRRLRHDLARRERRCPGCRDVRRPRPSATRATGTLSRPTGHRRWRSRIGPPTRPVDRPGEVNLSMPMPHPLRNPYGSAPPRPRKTREALSRTGRVRRSGRARQRGGRAATSDRRRPRRRLGAMRVRHGDGDASCRGGAYAQPSGHGRSR